MRRAAPGWAVDAELAAQAGWGCGEAPHLLTAPCWLRSRTAGMAACELEAGTAHRPRSMWMACNTRVIASVEVPAMMTRCCSAARNGLQITFHHAVCSCARQQCTVCQEGTCAACATCAVTEGVGLGRGTHSKWALYGDGDEPDTSDERVREGASLDDAGFVELGVGWPEGGLGRGCAGHAGPPGQLHTLTWRGRACWLLLGPLLLKRHPAEGKDTSTSEEARPLRLYLQALRP